MSKMTLKKKFVDGFSGIGGFRLPLERLGLECVWSFDNDWKANIVYVRRFGSENHYFGDIRKMDASKIPDHDLFCAGFPCQAFSVAGKRKGFQDTRGTLFHDIARIAEAKRPPLLLLENVKGLLSHDEGLTFQVILELLEELGYWVEWQVLNSKHFGVPQNRERVFIVGHLGDAGGREVFPVGEAGQDLDGAQEEALGEGSRVRREDNRVAGSLAVGGSRRERNLIADFNQNGNVYVKKISASLRFPKASQSNLLIANTLSSRYWKDGSENLIQVKGVTLANTSRYRQGVKRTPFKRDDLSWALNKAGDQGVFDGLRIRRLTPVECERLQGFPDGWTEGIADTNRYRLLGNAVTVNVIQFLGKRILERCLQRPS